MCMNLVGCGSHPAGPGWFPAAATHLVGDRVAFFSRATLQQIGDTATVLTAATPGFGYNVRKTNAHCPSAWVQSIKRPGVLLEEVRQSVGNQERASSCHADTLPQ